MFFSTSVLPNKLSVQSHSPKAPRCPDVENRNADVLQMIVKWAGRMYTLAEMIKSLNIGFGIKGYRRA